MLLRWGEVNANANILIRLPTAYRQSTLSWPGCKCGWCSDLENLSSCFSSIDFVFGDDKMVSLAAENYLFRVGTHSLSLHFGTKCFSTTRDARATSSTWVGEKEQPLQCAIQAWNCTLFHLDFHPCGSSQLPVVALATATCTVLQCILDGGFQAAHQSIVLEQRHGVTHLRGAATQHNTLQFCKASFPSINATQCNGSPSCRFEPSLLYGVCVCACVCVLVLQCYHAVEYAPALANWCSS